MYNLWLQMLAGFIDFSLFPFRPFTALFAGLSSYYFLIYILLPVSFSPFSLTWSFYSFGSHLRLTTNHIPPISTENCCCSITKSCLTLWNSMDCSTPGSSVLHYLLEFAQLMSIESMMLLNHLILCCPSPFAFIPKRIHNPYSPHHLEFSPHFFVSPRFTNLSELPLLWLCIQIHCFELLPCFPEKAITKNNFKNTCIYSLVNWHTL